MITLLAAPIVAFVAPVLAPAGETWETLSREFEQAFEAWVDAGNGTPLRSSRASWRSPRRARAARCCG